MGKNVTPESASIDPAEIERFSALAEVWWDENGPFKPLHIFNPTRINYVKVNICEHFNVDSLTNLRILDIGCGGGLLSEPMARLGADVTGIDASEKNIGIASHHAKGENLSIDYRATSVEALAESGVAPFDVVLNMEVIEHVADLESFVQASAKLVKPGGLMFIATLNRTIKSYGLAIIGAEYILRWLPRGTHQWSKFLKPSEVNAQIEAAGLIRKALSGVSYNPLTREWSLSDDVSVNYMMITEKGA